jgi:hypothetical protein
MRDTTNLKSVTKSVRVSIQTTTNEPYYNGNVIVCLKLREKLHRAASYGSKLLENVL